MIHVHLNSAYGHCYNVNEFGLLVTSAGFVPWCCWRIKVHRPNKKHFIGSGITESLKVFCQENSIHKLLINSVLSPKHQSELEKLLCVKIMDRNQLILELFSQRAHSYEGKLQVELANLAYLSTRLVRGWTHLERQRGGVGLRGGPGETQLEIDKRLLAKRIHRVQSKLTKFQKHRETTLKKRKDVFTVNLIGYTNAGKSTLFELLSKKQCYHDDRLFATLDPLSASVYTNEHKWVLTDTVGFIEYLPDPLLSAFKATLSEIAMADLLCIVIDVSDANYEAHKKTIETILEELNTQHIPRCYVYNKIDLINSDELSIQIEDHDACYISAINNQGIDRLRHYIFEYINAFVERNNKK